MRLRDRTKFATYKRRGEGAELVFITIAQGLGFNVAKIWGDSAAYDVSIEKNGWFLRVQVKSTERWIGLRDGSYVCQLHGSDNRLYTPSEVDYFACYVVPVDTWYIFPVARLSGMMAVALTPRLKGQKYARYMEAWGLLTRRHARQGRRTKSPSEKMRFNSMGRLTRRIIERLEGPCY